MAAAVGIAAAQGIDLESSVTMQATAVPGDPITEAPDAVWYVRPPAGGQFGPARGDVLRQWLQEGRVSADSMVWREGWTDWKTAGPIFPELDPIPPVNALLDPVANDAPDLPAVDTPPSPQIRGQVAAGRNRGGRKSLALVVLPGAADRGTSGRSGPSPAAMMLDGT